MSHLAWYTYSMIIKNDMKNQNPISRYRLAKRGETQTPYYGVWTPEEYTGPTEFPKSHKGLEAAIQLANSFESFVVAHNADCTTENVYTHDALQASIDQDKCDYYSKGTFHGDWIMNNIQLNENGNAVVDGIEYEVRGFDHEGHEAIVIHELDLISYDDGDSWGEME